MESYKLLLGAKRKVWELHLFGLEVNSLRPKIFQCKVVNFAKSKNSVRPKIFQCKVVNLQNLRILSGAGGLGDPCAVLYTVQYNSKYGNGH